MRKPHEGGFGRCSFRRALGEVKRQPIDTLRRRRIRRVIARTREACERRLGEIRVKAVAAGPGGVNPKGGASDRWLKNPRSQGTFERREPRNWGSAGRSGAFGAGRNREANSKWVLPG